MDGYSKELHGRVARFTPLRGFEDIVWIAFVTDGPLPDYDTYGSEGDVSVSEFTVKHLAEVDERGAKVEPPAIPPSVIRTKISRDFKHCGDALCWREKEGAKKSVTRERGALYLLQDQRQENGLYG